MTMQEKAKMMLGIGWNSGTLEKWWYVGNTAAVDRLGVPPLKMQDSAGGFRTYWTPIVGTVTCWPSLLSMAATFDVDIVHQFAVALGAEFAGKGANTILGPSINVHRVARNGRNFEYLSGEDPYLGARLTEQYVSGVQSQGVMAVMKHWVLNNQETNRNSESSVVDEKTLHELYYPPFEAGVEAGVSGVMCSYNQVNGTFSCENDRTLQTDLKNGMGFQGFVQSDWGATHSTSVSQGLDMEMPMDTDGASPPYYFDEAKLAKLPASAIDDAVERTLAAMVRLNVVAESKGATADKCSPPAQACLMANVTSDAHAAIARSAAAASIVLLKNDNGLLPLSGAGPMATRKIAIIGAAANGSAFDPTSDQGHGSWNTGDYYSGGGSGHITAGRLITPLAGLSRRAAAAGITPLSSPTNDIDAALSATRQADVAIVVAGSSSGEAMDRANLNLDGNADALIAAVAALGKPTIVLMQVPGAILTPWRDSVAAAAVLFLGGQETGGAWADVIFGDVSPTGKLPLVLPAAEADTIAPSYDPTVEYTEGMATSYRNTAVTPAYPFGHGLSYTAFAIRAGGARACVSPSSRAAMCVDATVTNTGSVRTAATVAQLYVGFPPEAGLPAAPLLKGFIKTKALPPGASQPVVFELTPRDLSYYDVATKAWVRAAHVDFHIGASSVDIRERLVHVSTTPQSERLVEA